MGKLVCSRDYVMGSCNGVRPERESKNIREILERLKIPLKMFVGQMEQEAESLEFCENLVSGKIEDWARFVDVDGSGSGWIGVRPGL